MSTAEPFIALGAGNGFPFCPDAVDVDTYDYWTTFSGWSKTTTPASDVDKAQSIASSRELAMKMFWSLRKMDSTIVSLPTAGLDITDILVTESFSDQTADLLEPKARVCNSRLSNRKTNGSNAMQILVDIAGMYLEGEFIGYGLWTRLPSGGFSVRASNLYGVYANLFIGGYGNSPTPSSYRLDDLAYVTISGISFVCAATAPISPVVPDFYDSTVDASSLTATCKHIPGSGVAYSSSASITAFDFYTYLT